MFKQIEGLLKTISKSYHELSIYDSLIVDKIETVIVSLNRTTDLIGNIYKQI